MRSTASTSAPPGPISSDASDRVGGDPTSRWRAGFSSSTTRVGREPLTRADLVVAAGARLEPDRPDPAREGWSITGHPRRPGPYGGRAGRRSCRSCRPTPRIATPARAAGSRRPSPSSSHRSVEPDRPPAAARTDQRRRSGGPSWRDSVLDRVLHEGLQERFGKAGAGPRRIRRRRLDEQPVPRTWRARCRGRRRAIAEPSPSGTKSRGPHDASDVPEQSRPRRSTQRSRLVGIPNG